MDSTYLTWASFLRITSISVAAYDYLITIPAEWRMYRSRGSMRFGWSFSKILFVLIRYVSILLLTISNFGYFYHGFSPETCSRYYRVTSALKVIQIMISQVIIGCRTWAITRRSKELGIFLLVLGSVVTALEWYANIGGRTPAQVNGNCSPGNAKAHVPQWVFYLMAMCFDAVTSILSTFYLVRSAGGIRSVFSMSMLARILFYDGLGYMVALTAVNVWNSILFLNSVRKGTQSPGASFGYMIVWIMSQQVLIHIHDAAEEHRGAFVTFPNNGHREGSHLMQNQFHSLAKDETESTNSRLDVQIQIEQTLTVDNYPAYGREDHRNSRV